MGWVPFFLLLWSSGSNADQAEEKEEGCRRNRERGRLQGGSISKMRSIEEMEGLLSQEDMVL